MAIQIPSDKYYYLVCSNEKSVLDGQCDKKFEKYKICFLDIPSITPSKNDRTLRNNNCGFSQSDVYQEFYEKQNDLLPECYVVGRLEEKR